MQHNAPYNVCIFAYKDNVDYCFEQIPSSQNNFKGCFNLILLMDNGSDNVS